MPQDKSSFIMYFFSLVSAGWASLDINQVLTVVGLFIAFCGLVVNIWERLVVRRQKRELSDKVSQLTDLLSRPELSEEERKMLASFIVKNHLVGE